MTTPPPEPSKFGVFSTQIEKGKAPITFRYPVPTDQAWVYLMLEKQEKLLDKINDKLAFFVFLALVAIGISAFSMCV